MVGRDYEFKMTDEEYDKYEAWCKENELDKYCGAVGGNVCFDICPTSLGEIVTAYAYVPVYDELGEISYNDQGWRKTRRIEFEVRSV